MPPDADLWHSQAIDALTALLRDDEDVKALVVIGSCAYPDVEPDTWSDLDLVLVAEDGAVARFYPASDWLAPLGRIYASAPTASGHFSTIRTYFTDGRRIDVIILPESVLAAAESWDFNPLCYGARSLFSRSPALDSVLEQSPTSSACQPPTPERLAGISEDFWFKAMLAAHKVARNDLLVALHLGLDLIRDCCVVAMMLRDRQEGTDHHRDGRAAQPFGYRALARRANSLVKLAFRSSLAFCIDSSTLASARSAVTDPASGNSPSGDSAPLALRKASM